MANGNNVINTVEEQGVQVLHYENTQRNTKFKAYQFCLVEFARGDDVPRRDKSTGLYLKDDAGNIINGVSRTVSSTTAMGGTLQHAVSNLKQNSFQRSVDFIKSALLPPRGKSMVEFAHDEKAKTLLMSCNVRLTSGCPDSGPACEHTFESTMNVADEKELGKIRSLAAEEIAAQIVAQVATEMSAYLEELEPDTNAEDNIAEALDGVDFG